jgi:hypothetical protein
MRWPTFRSIALSASLAGLLIAAPAASAADSATSPTPLVFGTPQSDNTAGFSIEPSEQNTTAFPNKCNSSFPIGVARTAWYSVQGTGGQVTVTTQGSGFDTALFVYSDSPAGGLVTCNDDISASDLGSTVTFASTAGTTYAIQAGAACNSEVGTPADHQCTAPPAGGVLKISAIGVVPLPPPPPPPPNTTPAGQQPPPPIGPSSGSPAPTPRAQGVKRIRVRVTNLWVVYKRFTKVAKLTVHDVPVGARVEVRCRGRGCPFTKPKRFRRRAPSIALAGAFRGSRLFVGTVIEIRVSAPKRIGTVRRFRIRPRPRTPKKTTLCLHPGQSKPRPRC